MADHYVGIRGSVDSVDVSVLMSLKVDELGTHRTSRD